MSGDGARRAGAEAIGTFFLVLIGPGAVMVDAATHGAIGHAGVALASGVGATVPAVSPGRAFAVEWLLSCGLMMVIVSVATDERTAPGFAGVAVGATVGFEAMMGGPLTGASMNPARSLGPAVAGGGWTAHWMDWLAPLTAMIAAAHVYDFLRPAGAPAVPRGAPLGVEGRTSPALDAAAPGG